MYCSDKNIELGIGKLGFSLKSHLATGESSHLISLELRELPNSKMKGLN